MTDQAGTTAPDSLSNDVAVEASAPMRVRLSRAKGWRMPPNTVKVSRPGKWGNRFRIGDTAEVWGGPGILTIVPVRDATTAVDLFEKWLRLNLEQHPGIMRAALDELRGKNLACWCKLGEPCHADVLLRLANGQDHESSTAASTRLDAAVEMPIDSEQSDCKLALLRSAFLDACDTLSSSNTPT